MTVPTYYRVAISSDVLFPRKTHAELHIRTEFKMLEEILTDSRCSFEPAFEEEKSNMLVNIIPVRVFVNRSLLESQLSVSGLALKAEKMSDIANYVLDSVKLDCLISAKDLESLTPNGENFKLRFKELCMESVKEQLKSYVEKLTEHPDVPVEPMHFMTQSSKFVTLLLPSEANRPQCLAVIHDKFGLENELIYGNVLSTVWSTQPGCHLINPHTVLATPEPIDLNAAVEPGKSPTLEMAMVPGFYRYFRYNEDGFGDSGWGCAYRSLQTVCSWFYMQSFTDKTEPTHKMIQSILVEIGDKSKDFIGSSKWIGSVEVSYVLDNYLGIKSRILSVPSGDELDTLASALIQHFRTDGAPVMIGGGVLAHTIVGVFLNRATGMVRYLVLDPHYTAPAKQDYDEEVNAVTAKGFVGWKDMSFWKKGVFYNLCLPSRPKPEHL